MLLLLLQGWLQSQPSGSPGASQLVATQRSQRSATLSGRPPSVAEVDESEFGGAHSAVACATAIKGRDNAHDLSVTGCLPVVCGYESHMVMLADMCTPPGGAMICAYVPITADGDASTGTRSTSRAFNKRDVPLSDWEIHESEVEICKRDDGSLWHLGGGSFGQVFKAIRNGVQPVAGAAQPPLCSSSCTDDTVQLPITFSMPDPC